MTGVGTPRKRPPPRIFSVAGAWRRAWTGGIRGSPGPSAISRNSGSGRDGYARTAISHRESPEGASVVTRTWSRRSLRDGYGPRSRLRSRPLNSWRVRTPDRFAGPACLSRLDSRRLVPGCGDAIASGHRSTNRALTRGRSLADWDPSAARLPSASRTTQGRTAMSYQTLTSYDVTGSAWRNARRLASGAKRERTTRPGVGDRGPALRSSAPGSRAVGRAPGPPAPPCASTVEARRGLRGETPLGQTGSGTKGQVNRMS